MPTSPGPAAQAAAQLLDLLARGAAAEEFTRVAAGARAAGASAEELAYVAEVTEVALGVHRTLGQHRRREAELEALFDTAGDLAALRDLDSVLRAIVRRARKLLHSDVAYLTLHDPAAGDTYMRVTDGSTSAAFQQLRLAMGDGLGGLVAQTARPYASADYRTDTRFRHVPAIDQGVAEEGLRGILGVPLAVGNRVIGVLFAADRSPRGFAPEAIALLASLADHAAIAIDSARRLEETRAALAGLDAANRTARAQSAAISRAAESHDRLMDLVLRGGTVGDLARDVAGVLGGALVVHGAGGEELARVGAPAGSPSAAAAVAPSPAAVAASRRDGRAVAVADGVWVCAVLAGPEPLGGIALTGRPVLDDADRRLFERACLVTALLLLMGRSVAEAEDRVRGELLDDLLTADPGAADSRTAAGFAVRARRVGVDLGGPHAVLVAHCPPEGRARLAAEAARRARSLGGLAGQHGGHAVLVVPYDPPHDPPHDPPCAPPGDTPGDTPRDAPHDPPKHAPHDPPKHAPRDVPRDAPGLTPGPLAASLAEEWGRVLGLPVTVGSAGPAGAPERIPGVYGEAVRCLEALRALGRTGTGAALPDLGFVGVLLGGGADVDGYVQRVLGPVLAYDAARGTELVRTLETYYAQGASLSRAKDALHVHVNTVVQRLERVALLLGPDWNEPARALENQLALRLRRLLTGGRQPAGG
ncbi:helix-turn-helix domain-containing protein [Streptomyces antimicrobicus]|uniref:GAF domain-containing protein n=1 Tax=Streptomyces antimicrobicus TaxID=2883108 RepID=A0ABS8B7Y8_9ACTN|nr:GAF domain-containing protein [Streptomyces antimicrobicus]MCB5180683.1 GAF domain-containing protein [Streptomyces antimicrobicus]